MQLAACLWLTLCSAVICTQQKLATRSALPIDSAVKLHPSFRMDAANKTQSIPGVAPAKPAGKSKSILIAVVLCAAGAAGAGVWIMQERDSGDSAKTVASNAPK